jgi:acyl-coenzyme A thioesterase PaaI-like protein
LLSVSLNLTQDFLNAGEIGEDVYVKAIVKKLGKSIAFTECVILNSKM